jgi:hypothetical protein
MKLAIVGSRDFDDYDFLKKKILSSINLEEISCVISGGARGADSLAERFADEFKISKEIYLADWKRHGTLAGGLRNIDVANACDVLIAFWDGVSPGTKDVIKKARCKHKKVIKVVVKTKG